MTKYYTRKDCFAACGDDDIPYIKWLFNSNDMYPKRILLEDPDDFIMTLAEADSAAWQIQRAKPKVMTVTEVLARDFPGFSADDDFNIGNLCHMFYEGLIQGRLKEYQKHAKLREACESALRGNDLLGSIKADTLIQIKQALKALTPPEA